VDRVSAYGNARHDDVLKLSLFLLMPLLLRADGGKLILRGSSAGETISVFADPYPMHANEPCDVSVLVQRDGAPVLDGTVQVRLGSMVLNGDHRAATNKLLFSVTAVVPQPGTLLIAVVHGNAQVSGEISVTSASPEALSYWPYFALVPVAIALFVLNRYLKRRREGSTLV
jgi:hypothetical protein